MWIFFGHTNYTEKKSTSKQCGFFGYENQVEKSTWKRRGFFAQQNYIKKVRGNDVEIRRNLVFDVLQQCPRRIDVNLTWWDRWVYPPFLTTSTINDRRELIFCIKTAVYVLHHHFQYYYISFFHKFKRKPIVLKFFKEKFNHTRQ